MTLNYTSTHGSGAEGNTVWCWHAQGMGVTGARDRVYEERGRDGILNWALSRWYGFSLIQN